MSQVEVDWRATVQLRSADELTGLWGSTASAGPRAIGVTDLLDLRTAYFRRTHPLPFTADHQARLAAGRELHAELGARLARRPEELEVRVRREGLVGQVDWLSDLPAELKSTANVPAVDALPVSRPQYLDQLGMYCAMIGVDRGRLLIVPSSGSPVDSAVAVEVAFEGPDVIWAQMLSLADRLHEAERAEDPAQLPRCAWFSRDCPYQAAAVCPCRGDEPEGTPAALGRVRRVAPDPGATEALRRALREVTDRPAPFPERFTDLIYPRRAYFRLAPPTASTPGAPWTRSPERDRLFRQIVEGVEATDPAGQGRLLPSRGGVREPVARLRGLPYLIKVTRAAPRSTPAAMIAEQSQYFLELGLRCQAVGVPEGWLLIGHQRAAPGTPSVAPYHVRFEPIEPLEQFATAREASLRQAIAARDPAGLAACPDWMYRDCPYRAACGCGSAAPVNR